tara:strand:+ start:349 stop:1248 length:900 start_codon:yes stop_codon:yes gene_type:complete
MGFLKKIGKSLKKVVKSIGKGIKKVAKKVFGAIGKLGPIGQLGLMFLGVPPVLGNFFSGVANFAGNFIPEAIKGAWAGIKAAGSGAWSSITEGISNGVDRVMNFTKGKGFTLSEGRTSIFTPKAQLDDKLQQIVDTDIKTEVSLKPEDILAEQKASKPFDFTKEKPSLLDRGKEFVSEQFDEFKETLSSPGQAAGKALMGGVTQGISTRTAMEIAGDPPTQMHLDMTPFMMKNNEQRLLDSTTWQGITNQYQQAGSAFGAFGDAATPYYAEMAGLDEDTFNTLVPNPTSPRPSTPSFFN